MCRKAAKEAGGGVIGGTSSCDSSVAVLWTNRMDIFFLTLALKCNFFSTLYVFHMHIYEFNLST